MTFAALFAVVGWVDAPRPRAQDPAPRPNGDIVAAGRDIQLSDSVPGDVMVAGGSVAFDGVAGGSYLGAGGELTVAGEVQGSVRAAGGSIELGATVGRNVTLAGGSITVEPGALIGGNAYLAGGTVRFLGTGAGDVQIRAGEAVLEGTFGGDVEVHAEALEIGPDVRIQGELRYRLADGGEPEVSAESGVIDQMFAMGSEGGFGVVAFLLKVLRLMLAAVVLVALFPTAMISTAGELERRPVAALLYGFLWLFLVPLIAIAALVTIIGVPLGLMLGAAYGFWWYLAPVVPALWAGDAMLRAREATDRRSAIPLAMLGSVVVAVALTLPWIGFLVRIVATCAGFGGVALAIGARRGRAMAV